MKIEDCKVGQRVKATDLDQRTPVGTVVSKTITIQTDDGRVLSFPEEAVLPVGRCNSKLLINGYAVWCNKEEGHKITAITRKVVFFNQMIQSLKLVSIGEI